MAAVSTRFGNFISEEVDKYQGRLVPVKASLPERIFTRMVRCDRLHPNPYDEFSDPSVGPNYEIVSGYEHRIKESRAHGDPPWDDPILVEKMLPDGYLILNGHHRWAAAVRMGLNRVRIRVVNLTQETDIRKMLELSNHDRRVTLDLDEVVFCDEASGHTEKAPGPLSGRLFKERLKAGVPALFHFLNVNGYDIWVYTSKYYSMEYIRKLFKRYHVNVNGIVTGTARAKNTDPELRSEMEKMFADRYPETIHIDNESVLITHSDSREFGQYDLSQSDDAWSQEIMKIIRDTHR